MIVEHGPVVAAFVGTFRFERATAEATVERAARTGDYSRLAGLPGTFHAAVSTPSATYVYGDIAGLRRVFHTTVDDQVVFSDHALLLQMQTGAPVDETWLAMWLACPQNGLFLDTASPFRGVKPVPRASGIRIDRGARPSTAVSIQPYWKAPDDDAPLAVGARALRQQLPDAVSWRVRSVDRASCDFSGGLDSSTIALLAARSLGPGASLLAVSQPARSPTNDDPLWAARSAAHLPPSVTHLKIDEDEWPLPFSDVLDVPLLDEPARPYALTSWLRYTARVLRGFGSAVHLCGHGGDQVMSPPLAYLSRLMRTRPRVAVGQFRAHHGLHPGLSTAEFLRILRPPSYRAWLGTAAAAVVDPGVRIIQSWGEAPRPPAWLTPSARVAVADAIRTAAPELRPLSSRVGQHATLDRVYGCATTHRLNRDLHAVLGVRLEVPFLDGDIVETCLSTRSDERADPLRVKPLLSDAMAGIVPPEMLARNTKASYQTDHCLGWRANHRQFAELFEDSRLARLGIVDGGQLRAAFRSGLALNFLRVATLNEVLVCELWLRALEGAGRVDAGRASEMVRG